MSKRLFLESNQAFNNGKPVKHNIWKNSSYIGDLFCLPSVSLSLSYTHIHSHTTPSLLCTLTFTTRVPAQDPSFFSFSIFPYIIPTVLLAPAGGSSFSWFPRLQKLDVNTVRSAPFLHALTLTHTLALYCLANGGPTERGSKWKQISKDKALGTTATTVT